LPREFVSFDAENIEPWNQMVSTGPDGFPACYRESVRSRSLFRLFNTIRTKAT